MLDFPTNQTLDQISLTSTIQAAKTINDKHHEVVRLGREAKEIAAEIGEFLIVVKKDLPHGEFGPWCEANLTFTKKTRAEYMRVAEVKSNARVTFDQCTSIREVLALGKPKPAPKAERRAATHDDLCKVERLQALRDCPMATEGERQAAQRKLDEMTAVIGPIPAPEDYSNLSLKEKTAKATDIAITKARKSKDARALIEYAMMRIYGRDDTRITEILNVLNTF